MSAANDGQRMAAGLKAIADLEKRLADRARHDADVANARPAPPSITDRPGRPERAAAERVRCPICKAQVGQQCHTQGRRPKPMQGPHPSRTDAAGTAVNVSTVRPELSTFHTTSEGS